MATFNYVAVNIAGQTIKGQIEANDRRDLDGKLARMGLEVIQAKPSRLAAVGLFQRGVKRVELARFCFYLEQLVRGGVPLLEGLTDLRDSVESKSLQNVTSIIIQEVESGTTLSNAMRKYPRFFDNVFVALISAGEESGELAQVLATLGETITWSDEVIKKTRKIFIYPIFALVVILSAAWFLLIYVVPPLATLITELGSELPPATAALIATSNFIQERWQFILIAPVAIFVGFKFLLIAVPGVDFFIDRIKIRIPLFGDVIEKLILSRFANTFGMLYSSGVSVVEALNISEGTLDNKFMSYNLRKITEEIKRGKALSVAFDEAGIFPPLVMRMMKLGETTGGIDNAMRQIKFYYDKDTSESIGKAQAAVGPVLMLGIAGLLAWIILAVYGPLYDIVGSGAI